MVAQDPARLSEQLLAWASQMTKVWFYLAWCSLMVRLSERAKFQSWAGEVSLAWANGLLAWASVHLG